jgi:TonB family protein
VLKTQPSSGAIAEQVQPDVLPKALESIHGKFKVRVRVAVDAAGNVSNASFDSEGPSKYFANAALKAAQQFKFKPAAPGAWILQFQFTRDGAEVISEAAQ